MALLNVNDLWARGRGRVVVFGSFRPNGATGVVSNSEKGKGWSVARTSTGLYTITFSDWGADTTSLESFVAGLRVRAAETPAFAVGSVVSASGKTGQIKVFQASAETRFVPLDIGAAREIAGNDIQNLAAHGGLMASDSVPDLLRVNTATDKALRITWAATEQDEIAFPPVIKPPDLDSANDVTVHLMVAKNGNTDTAAVIDVQAWDGVGDTEMGGNTAALATDALTEYTVTLAAANIAAAPGFLNIQIVPGAHANDGIYLYGAWLEYTSTHETSLAVADLAANADNEVDFAAIFRNTTVDT